MVPSTTALRALMPYLELRVSAMSSWTPEAPALYTGLRSWQWVESWFNLKQNDEWTCSTAAICS
jgi:hypothetical protein